MRFVLAVLMTTALLHATDPQAKKPSAAVRVPPRRTEIPAGAVERDPGRFFYTDKDGKKWIYVRTPFGISRLEDKPAVSAPPQASQPLDNVKVTESGDTVTFERATSFGVSQWQKKKADLTDEEKAALRRSQEDSAKPAKSGDVSTKQDR
jgi:hypothetical protein